MNCSRAREALIKLALAQLNLTVGDVAGNVAQIVRACELAKAQGASLVVTPELAISGYPPEDLLLRDDFLEACSRGLQQLCQQVTAVSLLVGHPQRQAGKLFNAASIITDGAVQASYYKQILPNDSVFDEKRYFSAGNAPLVFDHAGEKIGVLICADIWQAAPALAAKAEGASVLIALNASPFHAQKSATRLAILRERATSSGLPVVYVNAVGGQDELVFDGASLAISADGVLTDTLPAFVATTQLIHLNARVAQLATRLSDTQEIYEALKLGLRDYVLKNGFQNVLLGLSGGVDSALTLAIAVDALGVDRVRTLMMPSCFTASMSLEDAREMAGRFGVQYDEVPIDSIMANYQTALAGLFAGLPSDTTEENLQARIRGMLLMAISNKFGALVLTTGNKSEMATGYCTLYGDMAGGFSLLKDVSKTWVYRLCAYRNSLSALIPERVLSRAPSAELRANQKDSDNLPEYEVLDAIISAYVEQDLSVANIVALGYDTSTVVKVLKLIDSNEYKRRQATVGVRITERAFGRDRRMPITNRSYGSPAKLGEWDEVQGARNAGGETYQRDRRASE